MKSTHSARESSSTWITLTGIVLALLVCLLATSMVSIVYPQSSSYFEHLLAKGSDAVSLDKLAIIKANQPTPFMPGPTLTPTPTLSVTPAPSRHATPAPQQAGNAPISPPQEEMVMYEEEVEVHAEIPMYASVGVIKGSAQLYTLDCEAQAAMDWANFFGVTIDELEFIDRLPKSDDPETGFVGEINGKMGQLPPNSYGVHASPVADLLQAYGLPAKAKHDWNFTELKQELASGQPVIVWIVNLPFEIDAQDYTASNGNTSKVARFEHTWIVTGYNASTVTVVDSNWTYNVNIITFMERWEALGKQAIIYTGD